jgi:hypothetical protein
MRQHRREGDADGAVRRFASTADIDPPETFVSYPDRRRHTGFDRISVAAPAIEW